jgi:hypothetical protein
MKTAGLIFFLFGMAMTAQASQVFANRGLGFTISINKEASMSMSLITKNSKNPDWADLKTCSKSVFEGIKISHSLKCLYFSDDRGAGKDAAKEAATEVPFSIVDLIDIDELTDNLSRMAKGFTLENKETYGWGKVLSFRAAGTHAAHFFFLIPEDRTYSLRLGPFPDSVLEHCDLQFSKVSWTFHDN